jgi:hypothetical protein
MESEDTDIYEAPVVIDLGRLEELTLGPSAGKVEGSGKKS